MGYLLRFGVFELNLVSEELRKHPAVRYAAIYARAAQQLGQNSSFTGYLLYCIVAPKPFLDVSATYVVRRG